MITPSPINTPVTVSTPYDLTSSQPALLQGAGSTNAGQNVDAVSKDFEAVFLTQMLSAMFSGDEFTAFFGGGTAGDVYKGYFMDAYGKAMAQSGGIGIAAQVKQELLKLQEAA